jgi:hypothetical protein
MRKSDTLPMVDAAASPSEAAASQAAMKRILTAAWLAVIAGVLAQMVVIGVRAWAGGSVDGFIPEMAQGVTWSFLVCAAIAVGTLAAKAKEHFAGLLGLIAGPTAWAAAKGVQKGVQALAGAPQDQLTPLFWMVCGVKGVEYALLGVALAGMVKRGEQKLSEYLTLGALIGGVAACVVIALNIGNAELAGASVPLPKIASLLANEIFFICGCCTVIYTAQALTRHVGALRAS